MFHQCNACNAYETYESEWEKCNTLFEIPWTIKVCKNKRKWGDFSMKLCWRESLCVFNMAACTSHCMCEFPHLLLRCAAVILISVCVCDTHKQSWIKKKAGSQVPHLSQLLLVVTKQPHLSASHNKHTNNLSDNTQNTLFFAPNQIDTCRKSS